MKISFFIFSYMLLINGDLLAQINNPDIIGKWETEEGKIIKIKKLKNAYEGTTLDGAPILLNLTYEDDCWSGTIQNRGGDRSAKCSITMEGDDNIKIIARKGIFSKRFYWKRKE